MSTPSIPYKRSNGCNRLKGYLLSTQNGLCAICKENRPRCLDHNHKTGLTRGMLCNQCNVLLGMAKDSVETLQRAIDYLLFFKGLVYKPLDTQHNGNDVSRNSLLFLRNHTYMLANHMR